MPWELAPEWQKTSAVNGVIFNLDHPHAPARSSHENWLEEKRVDGWKFGPIKNAETKEHPCMVPFEELPIDQQKKDYLFKAIVSALK